MESVFGRDDATDEIVQYLCDVNEEYVPKVGMWFESIEEAGLFYKECYHNRGLSLDVRRTIENNDLSGIRSRQTFQSFVIAAGDHNECYFLIISITFFGSSPRTLPSASPRKEHFLSLILIVYFLSGLRSIGSLFSTSVLNIGAICGD
ncbi:hypothetical protein PIB30_038831 [Stylosanthes scabra]|uniref:Uncharacterized protein n=1 Tax=Stylosanthes scabra TaxID=79078 RepID=A0ABU6TEC1_9FABA|nr:hypothetical protein [Stylosanthes scabra]